MKLTDLISFDDDGPEPSKAEREAGWHLFQWRPGQADHKVEARFDGKLKKTFRGPRAWFEACDWLLVAKPLKIARQEYLAAVTYLLGVDKDDPAHDRLTMAADEAWARVNSLLTGLRSSAVEAVPFDIPGVARCGYRLHTANATYKALPTGVSGFVMTGRRYATIDDCIDNLDGGKNDK